MNEYEVAHEIAIKMNNACVNIQGNGTRAYELLEIVDNYAYVTPLSKGMTWTFHEEKVIYPSN